MNHIENLQLNLEKKLEQDWEEKWKAFGLYDVLKNNRRSKFYETLASEISEKSGIKIGRDTVKRFDIGEGGTSKYSLDAISKYLGYANFEQFSKNLPPISQAKSSKKSWYAGIALLLFFIVAGSVYLAHFIKIKNIEAEIIAAIQAANHTQYEAYKKLPQIDSLSFLKYYSSKGSAIKGIKTTLEETRKANRVIAQPQSNPSFYTIFDVKVSEIGDSTALAITEEHWFLKWYDLDLEKFTVSYDIKNRQLYEMILENKQWKVHNNPFEGKATAIDYD